MLDRCTILNKNCERVQNSLYFFSENITPCSPSSNEVMHLFKTHTALQLSTNLSSNITSQKSCLEKKKIHFWFQTLFYLNALLPPPWAATSCANAWLHWTFQCILMGFLAGTGTLLMIIKWSYTTSEGFITSLNISLSMMMDGHFFFSLFFFDFFQPSCNGSLGEIIKW